jgi:hypothetical protein
MPGYFPYLFQNSDGLTGEWNDMWCAFSHHARNSDTGDGLASGRNGPDSIFEIDLRPTGETQFAGTDEKVQGE